MTTHGLSKLLLEWFSKHGRDLPWRQKGGAHPDPYLVWVSEIMLQQTTVKTVIPYYREFVRRFPSVHALAAADLDDVLKLWQGLGYYGRVRKLHACAQCLVENYEGRLPSDPKELVKLPGIGPYSAASIAAFAFNIEAAAVDGNVSRVFSRLHGIEEPTSKSRAKIEKLSSMTLPKGRAADYTSALMDLGATVCTPSSPRCSECPWAASCVALKTDMVDAIPMVEKGKRFKKKGYVYLMEDGNNAFFIRKGQRKLLQGLDEFPWDMDEDLRRGFVKTGKKIRHVFTHFDLDLEICRGSAEFDTEEKEGKFVAPEDFKDLSFSTLMKKVSKAYFV